ncbi:MAG TPA: hypothetical protein VI789_08410 [Dehalococcoidia bacterium]|nr:hypothetical protein [Dehalococcoidia bacterium]
MSDGAVVSASEASARAQAIEAAARQVNQSLSAFSMRVYHEERAHPDWTLAQVLAELTHHR